MLESYLKDLAELVNRDCGTHNCAGVTGAAEIMKRHFESPTVPGLITMT